MRAENAGPRWLYLHGFASGPGSAKGVWLAEHYARRGIALERLDLRKPSFEHLRLSAIIEAVRAELRGPWERAVVFGSSLGGLAACRAAEEDARICALVLRAPAFRLAERWRARMGERAWAEWERSGWLETYDFAEQREARVDFEFIRDAERVDARNGGWPDVRVPTLVVQGTRDDFVDPALAREGARGKRHVRLVEVDDGHELRASVERIAREADEFLRPWLGA